MTDPLAFARLHVGLDQTSPDVERLVTQLASPNAPRPLVFETIADDNGVRHFVGRSKVSHSAFKHLLNANLPTSSLSREKRPAAPTTVGRLVLRLTLPLADDPLPVLFALRGALESRRKAEAVGIQIVLGRGRGPQQVPRTISEPNQPVLSALLHGSQRASSESRRRLVGHHGHPRIEVTVRLAVSAPARPRLRALQDALLGTLRALEAPGASLRVATEKPSKWQAATMTGRPLTLSPRQISGLLGWPLDHQALPGLPPAHPRSLAPPKGISKGEAIFASAIAPGHERLVGIAADSRLQHLAVTGGTGSGKSMLLARLCIEDISAGRPTLLVDPKRQLVDYILERVPQECLDSVVVIDAADPLPVGLNPLDLGERDPDVVVDGILSVLRSVFEDGWGPRTEDLLHAGLLTLARDGARRRRPHTLLDLPRLLSDGSYRRQVIGAVSDDPTLASFWSVFDGLSPSHRASVIAPPMNKLRKYLLRRNVGAILGQEQPRFRMRDLFREGKTVLVPLNDALLGPGSAQLIGGLVVAEAWLATMERATETNPSERPGMIFIDEVQRFLHLPTSIEDALATSRSYGVAWHVALQGRSQIPTSMALALELNARNKITFAASPNDAAVLARSTKELTAEDFQALGRYEIYANLVVDGAPAGWFSARTLPPLPELGNAALVRAANQRKYGRRDPVPQSVPVGPTTEPAATPTHQKARRT